MYVQYELLIYTVIVIPSQLRVGYEGGGNVSRRCLLNLTTSRGVSALLQYNTFVSNYVYRMCVIKQVCIN